MPQTANEAQAEDGGYASMPQRIIRLSKTPDDSDYKRTNRRLKDIEVCVPIVYGTIAFYLGRKASEYHHLKLYPEDESGPLSTKKPVVMESYNEIVFPYPSEWLFAHLQNHPAVLVPRCLLGLACLLLYQFKI